MSRRKRKPGRSGRGGSELRSKARFGRREQALLFILFVALGIWGLVSLVQRGGDEQRPVRTSSGERSEGVVPGRVAPDFTIQTVEGEPFRLSGQRGRVVVLDFLAPG